MDLDTPWPCEQPRQTGSVQEESQQQQQQQDQIPEIQSGDASSMTELNAYQILPPDMEQEIAASLGLMSG